MEGEGLGEVGVGELEGLGYWTRIMGTSTLFAPLPLLCSFSFVLFSASQVSSVSFLPPLVQTGTNLPLNAFSWAFPPPDNAGVAVVNNTAGTLFGHSCGPRHRATMGGHGCPMGSVDARRG